MDSLNENERLRLLFRKYSENLLGYEEYRLARRKEIDAFFDKTMSQTRPQKALPGFAGKVKTWLVK